MTVLDGDVLRVTANFELGDGTQYQNIYHYIRDGTDPISDALHVTAVDAAMEAAYDELVAMVKDDVVEQLSFVDRVEWVVDQWKVIENIGVFVPNFVPVAGTDALPFQSSPFVVFKTLRPRSVGKKFLFPFVETAQASTILTAGATTAMAAFGAIILTPLAVGGDVTLTAGVPRTGVDAFLLLQVAVINDVIGSQKRRRPGVGA